jgi:predicted AAA+ superfamily ATPase
VFFSITIKVLFLLKVKIPMQRHISTQLSAWKNKKNRKPLIIRGARQVGKTWAMKQFGQTDFRQTAYINFDNNERMKRLFEGDYDINRLINGLKIESGVDIQPENTLLIFDEIQEVPRALSALKYFYEQRPEFHIVAAGSLLGVALHNGTSFPVGKVDFLNLYPMDFCEFLLAMKQQPLLDLLIMQDWQLISDFKSKYIGLLRQYYFIGGMPEVVQEFVDTQNMWNVRQIQKNLLLAYEQDFSKYAESRIVPRIRLLWNEIPTQLAKENKKFVFSEVQQGTRARDFEIALRWLKDCGLVYSIYRVKQPKLPLTAYQDNAFKLFSLDVGLLAAQCQLDETVLLEGNRLFTEFKGALTEQYVLQQLLVAQQYVPFYWSAERGMAEVDFVLQHKQNVIPIEVKAEENLKAKSLKSYCEKYQPHFAVRSSMSNFRKEEWLINLPLYAISQLENLSKSE